MPKENFKYILIKEQKYPLQKMNRQNMPSKEKCVIGQCLVYTTHITINSQ